jgi:hypothetical protein
MNSIIHTLIAHKIVVIPAVALTSLLLYVLPIDQLLFAEAAKPGNPQHGKPPGDCQPYCTMHKPPKNK